MGNRGEPGPPPTRRVAVIDPSTGAAVAPARSRSPSAALATGVGVGLLGGLIGLGGAEFRLPLLIGLFGFGQYFGSITGGSRSIGSSWIGWP